MNKASTAPWVRTLLFAACVLSSAQAAAQDLLVRNALLHSMNGDGITENADILIVDGRINAVGSELATPASKVRVIDAKARIVTPGLFAGISALGLEDVSAEAQTRDSSFETATGHGLGAMRPEFDVTRAYNPHSSLIPVTRIEGYTFTLLAARRANTIIAGQGRMVTLDGGYRSFSGEPALFIDLGASASGLSGGSRAGQWMLLEQALSELGANAGPSDQSLLTPAGREVLGNYRKTGRVVFSVDRAGDILTVIEFAETHTLNAVIVGGAQAWMVAEQLAGADIPVILDPLVNLPDSFDRIGARLDNAALLHAAGVTIAFAQTPDMETHNARRMRQLAGNAVAHGLPHQAALAALTINPARIFGMGAETGSIAPGMRADLVIWSGDPLEVTSLAEQVVIGGVATPMISRQTLLRDRYLPQDPATPRAYINKIKPGERLNPESD